MKISYTEKIQIILESFVDNDSNVKGPFTSRSFYSNSTIKENVGNQIPSILLELKSYGLLESNSHVVLENRLFYITGKGLDVIRNGGIKEYFTKIATKEKLENKILKATSNSFSLNKLQLAITIILAIGTFFSILIQYYSYAQEKEKLKTEIRVLKNQLERDLSQRNVTPKKFPIFYYQQN